MLHGMMLLEMGEVAGDLGTGPILGVHEFAAEQAVFVDDVGFGIWAVP